ncbi:MAG TPA: sigma-70 family RNA polymerase sigma factor [Myxococcales bacterium]|jgi:RNA polymerase sigma-70 factor (ECF subfamily)
MTRLVDDRPLLEAFRRGEPAALAEVYREYARPLFAFLAHGFAVEGVGGGSVFKGLREPWAREEAVQEIFVRAFSPAAREAYDGLRPYRNYLLTIARNYVLDGLRRGGREVLQPDASTETSEPAPGNGPDDLAGSKEVAAHCEAFVASLDAEDRQVFGRRFREGLSIEQTGQATGLTEHRVKKAEARIRKRFFLRMKELGYFEGLGYGREGLRRIKLGMLLVLLGGAA